MIIEPFTSGTVELNDVTLANAAAGENSLGALPQGATNYVDATVKSVRFTGSNSQIALAFDKPTAIVIQPNSGGGRGGSGGGGRCR